jgi:glutamate racemase
MSSSDSHERFIAGFDSGLGGLSALAPLLQKSASLGLGHNLNYLGDLANLPYGSKSQTRIRQLVQANLRYLVDEKSNPRPELLIIACNTASAFAFDEARAICETRGIPCVGVIEASCRQALKQNPSRILVLATKGTVSSSAYPNTLQSMGYKQEIISVACPLFVPFVEEGVTEGPALQWIIQKYLSHIVQPGDLAILGCTHYPFLSHALEKAFPQLKLVHAGEALLYEDEVKKLLMEKKPIKQVQKPLMNLQFTDDPDEAGKLKRFLTDLNLKEHFESQVQIIKPLTG